MAYEANNNVEQLAGLGLGAWRIAKWWLIAGAVCALLIAVQAPPHVGPSEEAVAADQARSAREAAAGVSRIGIGCAYINHQRAPDWDADYVKQNPKIEGKCPPTN